MDSSMHQANDDGEGNESFDGSPASPLSNSSYSNNRPLSPIQSSPFSPRSMAVDVLKRAASLRENNGSPSSSTAASPGVARMGLERSASDAARRLAMAKLTGEKVEIPPEYTTPVQALPSGPPPSLADLQARHEQRMGLTSPTPSDQQTASETYGGSSNSRSNTPMPAISSPLASSHGHGGGDEDEDSTQRRTDERQEARTNLIRKLSRGRLAAGAAAAAGARERAGVASPTQSSSGGLNRSPSNAGSPIASPLQRRPSLGESLARSASQRQKARALSPELQQNALNIQQQFQLQQQQQMPEAQEHPAQLLPPAELTHLDSVVSPASTSHSDQPPTSSGFNPSTPGSSRTVGLYDHIPVPPTPESANSDSSPTSKMGGLRRNNAATTEGHESVYSAVSNFRPYRHTMERDRDSAIARYEMEDNFEYDLASNPALSRSNTAQRRRKNSLGVGMNGPDEQEESITESATATRQPQAAILAAALRKQQLANTFFSPPDSPLDARMIPSNSDSRQEGYDGNGLSPQAYMDNSARSPISLPETPQSVSPVSQFVFSPTPDQKERQRAILEATTGQPITLKELSEQEAQEEQTAGNEADVYPTPFSFLSHQQQHKPSHGHGVNYSTDSFPVSVSGSVSGASNFPGLPQTINSHPNLFTQHQHVLPSHSENIQRSEEESRYDKYEEDDDYDDDDENDEDESRQDAETTLLPPHLQHQAFLQSGTALPQHPLPALTTSTARKRSSTGPSIDYKFPTSNKPTARLAGSRPTSIASNGDNLDNQMDEMIGQLESLQAANTGEGSTRETKQKNSAAVLDVFAHRVHNHGRPLESHTMQAQTSASSALHDFHESHDDPAMHIPHELPVNLPAPTPPESAIVASPQPKMHSPLPYAAALAPAPTSALPIPPATSADYAKYSHSKLNPFPGIADLEKQRASPASSARSGGSGGTMQSTSEEERRDRERDKDRERKFGAALGKFLGKGTGQDRSPAPAHPQQHMQNMYQRSQESFTEPRPPTAETNDSAPSLARTGSTNSSNHSQRSDEATQYIPTNSSPPAIKPKEQVMQRLSTLLATYGQPNQHHANALKTPPRQMLLHTPVLQVVNANTVKDRYLFLFTDILLIAKPLVEEDSNGEPIPLSLDTRFLVKSIVELPKLKLTAQAVDSTEDPVQKRKHPLLLTFVDRFANDPKKSIAALIAKAGLSNDAATVANLLFRNPELNRSQLGTYLSGKDQKPVLKAYCERFRMAGIRIEDALRVFVGSLRLPNDYSAAEYLLSVFASQWMAANPGSGMTNDGVFATKLVISIMELNDALHSGINDETAAAGNLFSFPNHAITVDDFIAAFRLKDPHSSLPDEALTRVFLSIRRDRLQQAADNSIASVTPEIEVIVHPAKLPNRLTYRTASENISITIPKPDAKFAIKLVGQDLRFEPPVLTFARSRTATFRITPTSLGNKAMLFVKLGANANFYRNLPVNKTFAVERAFMNHTFQIAFVNHLNVKRKYLFSMGGADVKYTWVETLKQRIENSPIEQADVPRATKVSAAVALQVLRDALLSPDEPAPVLQNKPIFGGIGKPGFNSPPSSRQGLRSAAGMQRSNSISRTYAHGAGRAEIDLTERRPSGAATAAGAHGMLDAAVPMARRGSRDEDKLASSSKTGTEIVTTVQQNSLLPFVLGFMSAGAGVDAMPRQPVYPNPLPVQAATPPQAVRGTGRFRGL